jgi:hypothetical protein
MPPDPPEDVPSQSRSTCDSQQSRSFAAGHEDDELVPIYTNDDLALKIGGHGTNSWESGYRFGDSRNGGQRQTAVRPKSLVKSAVAPNEEADMQASFSRQANITFSQAIKHTAAFRKWLQVIVECPRFEAFSGVLVLLNALSIGVETEYMARKDLSESPASLHAVETLFCAIFTAELAVRVFCYRLSFFHYYL